MAVEHVADEQQRERGQTRVRRAIYFYCREKDEIPGVSRVSAKVFPQMELPLPQMHQLLRQLLQRSLNVKM